MNAETFLENFSHLANAPKGIERIRKIILRFAVRGQLASHKQTEESAFDDFPAYTEHNETVKSLPATWLHIPFGKIGEWRGGGTPSKSNPEFWNGDIPWVSPKDMKRPCISETKDLISEEAIRKSSTKLIPPDSILIVIRGMILIHTFPVAYAGCELTINQDMKSVIPVHPEIRNFLLMALNAFEAEVLGLVERSSHGTCKLLTKDIQSFLIPLPPLEEQKRIVGKVDELMKLCDELEEQQQSRRRLFPMVSQACHARLAAHPTPTNLAAIFTDPLTLSPDDMRKTILSLAIRGRLVEQDSADEPADALLARIGKSTKKIKRRNLSKAGTYEQPFALPNGWSWAKFPDLGTFGRGKSRHRPRNDPRLYTDGTYKLVQTGDVARAQGTINTFTNKYNAFGLEQSNLWPMGTMCITIAANIADTGILGFEACIPDSVVGFIPSEEFPSVRYFEYFMRTMKTELENFAPSTAQKNINLGILEKVWIPIPPASEQDRIVSKVDELMELVDEIKLKRSTANQCGELFAQAAVASITGTEIEEHQDMKAPKTELVTSLIAEGNPKNSDNAPLTTIIAKSKSEVSAKELWQKSGLEIDAFYSQLKTEMNNGWIAEPKKGFMKEVEAN